MLKDFNLFQHDKKTRRAIERNIEIIGEAINRTLKLRPDIEIINARKIALTPPASAPSACFQ